MSTLRITYDEEADVLAIYFSDDDWKAIDQIEPEKVIAHYNESDQIVALEIIDARDRLGGDPLASIEIERYAAHPEALAAGQRAQLVSERAGSWKQSTSPKTKRDR